VHAPYLEATSQNSLTLQFSYSLTPVWSHVIQEI